MTLLEFAGVFAALAMQLRQTDADEATIRAYYELLKERELELVALAAARLAKEATWFPRTSEWCAMVGKVEAERLAAQRAFLRKLPSPLCPSCSDTGWAVDDEGSVRACDCRPLRRLELLGRRPWPALPAAAADSEPHEPQNAADESAAARALLERLGVKLGLRMMSKATVDGEEHDNG